MNETKIKTWPNFAIWSQKLVALWQGNEETDPSKPLAPALYLVATPIGNLGDITLRALWALTHVDAILCEDTRVTGKLLHHYGIKKPLISCHDHNEEARSKEIVSRLAAGESFALVSDAGTPLLSDPGFRLTRACREAELDVFAIPGASALLTALGSAGLPTDQFVFAGFLPAKQVARCKALEKLEAVSGTLIFYESAKRLSATLNDMAKMLSGKRQTVVARELTKLYEETKHGSLDELSAHYEQAPTPKGEIVILLGPQEAKTLSQEDIDAALIEAMESQSLRDAAASVAEALDLNKKPLYQRALTIKNNK